MIPAVRILSPTGECSTDPGGRIPDQRHFHVWDGTPDGAARVTEVRLLPPSQGDGVDRRARAGASGMSSTARAAQLSQQPRPISSSADRHSHADSRTLREVRPMPGELHPGGWLIVTAVHPIGYLTQLRRAARHSRTPLRRARVDTTSTSRHIAGAAQPLMIARSTMMLA